MKVKALRYGAAVVLVLACLPAAYHAPRARGAESPPQVLGLAPEVLVSGAWGGGQGEFWLQREEGAFGPGVFAVDARGRLYVCDPPIKGRVQVFAASGSLVGTISTRYPRGQGVVGAAIGHMWVCPDGAIYAADGLDVFACLPGAERFQRLFPQGPAHAPGVGLDLFRSLSRVVRVREGAHERFYVTQGGGRPDGGGTSWINKYDASWKHLASVEGHELCADPEGRHICAVLGGWDGPAAGAPVGVLVIEAATGEARRVELGGANESKATERLSLVGCDATGRLYMLATTPRSERAPPYVRVYDPEGRSLVRVPLQRLGSRDVFLDPGPLVRVGAAGDIYVASATLREGYRIEKYSWRER